MKRVVLALLFAGLSGGVMAAEIPQVDIDALCEKQSGQGKYDVWACKALEGSSRLKLREKWGYIPERVADMCLRGTDSYLKLNICLDESLKRMPGVGVSLSEGGREVRYWTLVECMDARNGGTGVCITH